MSTADEMNEVISRAIAEIEKLRREKDQLVYACNGLLGLIQIVCARDDTPGPITHAMETSHRVEEAIRVVATVAQ